MASGPGIYDEECTVAKIITNGETVVLLVINGIKGTGFDVQSHNAEHVAAMPEMLRWMADEIENSDEYGNSTRPEGAREFPGSLGFIPEQQENH